MDTNQIAQVAAQANAVGNSHGVFCVYKYDAGKFVWIFYRKGNVSNTRLGKTADPKQVMKRMEKYICTL